MSNTLKYTYFYPAIVGIEINGVKMRMEHALIFGFWRARENMTGWNSNENAETTAEALCMNVKTYKNLRSELINAGLLTAERGDKNEVKKVHTVDDSAVLTFPVAGTVNGPVSHHRDDVSHHRETETGVATPISNNIRNIETEPSRPDGRSGSDTQWEDGHFSSLTESERSERGERKVTAQAQPSPAQPDPFAEATTGEVFSVKPQKTTNDEDRKAGAAKNELYKVCVANGYKISQNAVQLFSVCKSRLKEGYTVEDIKIAAQNYFNSPADFQKEWSLFGALSEKMFDQALNNKLGGSSRDKLKVNGYYG